MADIDKTLDRIRYHQEQVDLLLKDLAMQTTTEKVELVVRINLEGPASSLVTRVTQLKSMLRERLRGWENVTSWTCEVNDR